MTGRTAIWGSAALLATGIAAAAILGWPRQPRAASSEGAAATGGPPRLAVAATTTMLAALLRSVGGADLDVVTLAPPNACPGHSDISPGDATRLASTQLVFRHDFQEDLAHKLAGIGIPVACIRVVEGGGPLSVPGHYLRATERVAEILAEVDPPRGQAYRDRARQHAEQVRTGVEEMLREWGVRKLRGTPVLCARMQAALAGFLGLEIVATFDGPEALSAAAVRQLSEAARQRGARLVLGNLQGGQAPAAEILGRAAGLPHVILSNFPGAREGEEDYLGLLRSNTREIAKALPEAK